jgi:hypothetical protein
MSKRPYVYIIMATTILTVLSCKVQTQPVESEIAYPTTNNYPAHFSAEVETTFVKGTKWLTKVYKEEYLLRTDIGYNSYRHIYTQTIITNLETQESVAVFPDSSDFEKWKFVPTDLETAIDISLLETENFGGTHTFVGEEIIEGIPCYKFAVTYYTNSRTGPEKNGTSWINERTNLPVKVQLDDLVSSIKNVKIEQQDPKLFELPKGYHEYQPSL